MQSHDIGEIETWTATETPAIRIWRDPGSKPLWNQFNDPIIKLIFSKDGPLFIDVFLYCKII